MRSVLTLLLLYVLVLALLCPFSDSSFGDLWPLKRSRRSPETTVTAAAAVGRSHDDGTMPSKGIIAAGGAIKKNNKVEEGEGTIDKIGEGNYMSTGGAVYIDRDANVKVKAATKSTEAADPSSYQPKYCLNNFFSVISIPVSLTKCSSFLRQKLENVGILSKLFESSNSKLSIFIDNNHDKMSVENSPTAFEIIMSCNTSYKLSDLPVTFRSLNASLEWLNLCSLSSASAEEVFRWGTDPIESERRSHVTRLCLARELRTSTYVDLEVLPYDVNNILSNTSYSVAITLWDKSGFNFEFSNSIFCLPGDIINSMVKIQDAIIREHVAMKSHFYKSGMRKKLFSPMHHSKHRQAKVGQGLALSSDYALQELSHPVLQKALSNTHLPSIKFLAQNAPGDVRSRRLIHLLDKLDLSHYYIVGDRSSIGHESNYNKFAENLLFHAQNYHINNKIFYSRPPLHSSTHDKIYEDSTCRGAFSIIGDGYIDDCCSMMATRQYQEMVIFHAVQFALNGVSSTMMYYVIPQSPCGSCQKELGRIDELLSIVEKSYKSRYNSRFKTGIARVDNYVIFNQCLAELEVKGFDLYLNSYIKSRSFQSNEANLQSSLLKLCMAMKLNFTYISLNSIAIDKDSPALYMKAFVSAPSRTSFHYGPRSALSSAAFCLSRGMLGSAIRSFWQRHVLKKLKHRRSDEDEALLDMGSNSSLLMPQPAAASSSDSKQGEAKDSNDYVVEINYDKKKKMNVYKRVKKNLHAEFELKRGETTSSSVRLNSPGIDISMDAVAEELFYLWRKRSFMLLTSNDHGVADFHISVDDAVHFDHKFIFVTQAMVDNFSPLNIKGGGHIPVKFLNDAALNSLHYSTTANKKAAKAIRPPPIDFKVKSYFYLGVSFISVDYKTMLYARINDTDATVDHNADPDRYFDLGANNGNQVKQADVEGILNMLPADILAGLDLSGL